MKKHNPRNAGRKKRKITEKQLEEIRKLAGYGLTYQQIRNFFGWSRVYWDSRKEDQPEFYEALRQGEAAAISRVSQTAYEQAVSGKNPTMTIFWLKSRAGWREKVKSLMLNLRRYS